MTSAVERHAELIDKGWTVRLDGKWRPPNPTDMRVYTFAAAWAEHTEQTRQAPTQSDIQCTGRIPPAEAP